MNFPEVRIYINSPVRKTIRLAKTGDKFKVDKVTCYEKSHRKKLFWVIGNIEIQVGPY